MASTVAGSTVDSCFRAGGLVDLAARVAALPAPWPARFDQMYQFQIGTGTLDPPAEMVPWLTAAVGPVESVRVQTIVRVRNRITGEGALFNPLRARRPTELTEAVNLAEVVARSVGDPFCDPERLTPRDSFGRIVGRHCLTAGNLAKFAAWHGLVIFDRHDPLDFDVDRVVDYLATAEAWFAAAHRADPAAVYPLLTWNCLWKAGASITHGHAQIVLDREFPHDRVAALVAASDAYRTRFGRDYWADWGDLGQALDLGFAVTGGRVAASLTPLREREVILWSLTPDAAFRAAIGRTLVGLRDLAGVRAFNVAIVYPPQTPDPAWRGFPALARICDRGDPAAHSTDVAAMELYGSGVVSRDPFETAAVLHQIWHGTGRVD